MKKGTHCSEEFKKKLSIAHLGQKAWNKGVKMWEKKKHPMSGKKHSPETIKKYSETRKGCKSPNWKGGLSVKEYSIDWTDILRESIRKRDECVCQLCGICQDELEGWVKQLDIHHIDYDKENCNQDNLISLCRSCHVKTNYNRNYWFKLFKNI